MKRIDLVKSSNKLRTALTVALLLLASVPAPAAGVNKKVRFARGSTSTTIDGAVARGDRDRYTVGARAGQRMTVRVHSLENNAVFQIYRPGGKRTLAGAGEGEDATAWEGELPAAGNYVIVVGGTRGGAEYSLSISIE
jgi:hypothetical protein